MTGNEEKVERIARALQLRDLEYDIEHADNLWDETREPAAMKDAYKEAYRDDARKILKALELPVS